MLKLNGNTLSIGKFPNGECYCDIPMDWVKRMGSNVILMKFESDEDVLFLQFVKDFLDEINRNLPCDLYLPYIPYSRMDRKENNRLFTLKSFAKMVNRMGFSNVFVLEPHSEVSLALFDNIHSCNFSITLGLTAMMDVLGLKGSAWLKPKSLLNPYDDTHNIDALYVKGKENSIYFVYPDAGAEKRYSKQSFYGNILTCCKHRDFNIGKNMDSDCKVAIIIDDLCSNGETFIDVADALKMVFPNIEKIILCVSHCEDNIFNGFVLSGDSIDKVYTTDSILNVYKNEDLYNKYKDKFDIVSADLLLEQI